MEDLVTGREVGVILGRQRCFDSGGGVPGLWAQVWLVSANHVMGCAYQSAPYWDK